MLLAQPGMLPLIAVFGFAEQDVYG